jgi:uncharacterized membrane protein YhaH (DUF805 family)
MALALLTTIAQTIDYTTTDVTTTNVNTGAAAGIGIAFFLFYFVILLFYIVCMVKIFQKANRQWWEAIIPIYNIYILLKIIGRPAWWLLLFFVPFVNFVISIIVAMDLAKSFKKDATFGIVLLWLFSFIGYPILAFGSDTYVGPVADVSGSGSAPPPPPSAPSTPSSGSPAQQPPASPPSNLVQ